MAQNNREFAVLGLGRFGMSVLEALTANGHAVLGCDSDPDIVREASRFATHVIQADITNEAVFESIGISHYDAVVIAVADSLEASILATMMAKEHGAKYVITKASTERQRKILESVGADRVVMPERDMGIRLAANLFNTNIIDIISLSEEFGVAEVEPLPEFIGKTLNKSNIRSHYGLNVIAIMREGRVIVPPKAEDSIEDGDSLVVVGENVNIQRLISGKKA